MGRACEHHQPHTEAVAPGGGRGGATVVPEVSEGQGGGCSEAAGDGVQDVEERILRGSGQWSGILWGGLGLTGQLSNIAVNVGVVSVCCSCVIVFLDKAKLL